MYKPKSRYGSSDLLHIDLRLPATDPSYVRIEAFKTNAAYALLGLAFASPIIVAMYVFM